MAEGFGLWTGAVLDLPAPLVDAADEFWCRALGWTVGPAWPGHPEFHRLEPPEGTSHLLVQTIEGPPRVHLDLYAEDAEAETDRIVALGAARTARQPHWQELASPAGLPFCVVTSEGERVRPPAPTWQGGHRSRLVQVCIDVPYGRLDDETAFWRAVTGWPFEPAGAPEFAGHLRPGSGGSLQLLVQELGESDPATSTRAHLDLGADDTEAEATRLAGLGAEPLDNGRSWVVMRDPAGLVFCVTRQRPG